MTTADEIRKLGNSQAFPRAEGDTQLGDEGMTLRQWYAGLAMQGMLAYGSRCSDKEIAELSFRMAEAMLQHQVSE